MKKSDHSYLHILIMLCIASITVYSTLDCIRLFSHITATAIIVLQFLLFAINNKQRLPYHCNIIIDPASFTTANNLTVYSFHTVSPPCRQLSPPPPSSSFFVYAISKLSLTDNSKSMLSVTIVVVLINYSNTIITINKTT